MKIKPFFSFSAKWDAIGLNSMNLEVQTSSCTIRSIRTCAQIPYFLAKVR